MAQFCQRGPASPRHLACFSGMCRELQLRQERQVDASASVLINITTTIAPHSRTNDRLGAGQMKPNGQVRPDGQVRPNKLRPPLGKNGEVTVNRPSRSRESTKQDRKPRLAVLHLPNALFVHDQLLLTLASSSECGLSVTSNVLFVHDQVLLTLASSSECGLSMTARTRTRFG
jgi:hypothetical protein